MSALTIVYSFAILAGLALIFSVTLAVVSKKLAIKEDVRIGEVEKRLAGANCGACGYAGCGDLARAIVAGKAKATACPVTTKEKAAEIAGIIGEAAELGEDTVLVVACAGGVDCRDKYDYQGYGDCATVELLAGGRKACPVGCIGMGKCTDQCAYHAIEVGEAGYATINQSKCVKCGLCATACPKKLIKRIPASAKVYLTCSNKDKGKYVREVCTKGCIGCGMCQKICPEGAIVIVDNLPQIDYSKCVGCLKCVEKCPTKALVARK